jgi:hypothetical protein
MHTVKIQATKLLGIVKENRQKHIADYEEAMTGYRRSLADELNKKLADLAAGGIPDPHSKLPIPSSHEKEYNSAILKLELTSDDIVELEHQEFQQFVMDEWAWKAVTDSVNSMYKTKR